MEKKYNCSICKVEKIGIPYKMETGDQVCDECIQTGYIVYLQQKKNKEWWALSLFKTREDAELAAKDVMNFPFIIDYIIEEAVYGQKSTLGNSENNKIKKISATELKRWIEAGEGNFQIIDIRATEELEKGSIPGAIHITIQELPHKIIKLPKEREYIIVCSHGLRAKYVCEFLEENGYHTQLLTSGMMGWNGFGFVVSAMDTVTSLIKIFNKKKIGDSVR